MSEQFRSAVASIVSGYNAKQAAHRKHMKDQEERKRQVREDFFNRLHPAIDACLSDIRHAAGDDAAVTVSEENQPEYFEVKIEAIPAAGERKTVTTRFTLEDINGGSPSVRAHRANHQGQFSNGATKPLADCNAVFVESTLEQSLREATG